MTSGGNGHRLEGRYWEELAPAIVAGLRERGNELRRRSRPCSAAGVHLRERLGGAPYARAQNLRPWLRQAYDQALDDIDVLLMPTTPFRAFRLDDELRTSERVLRGWANLANTYPTDMSGVPRSHSRWPTPTACRSASCSSGTASRTRGCSRSPRPASGSSAGPRRGPLSPSSARRT